MHATTPCHWRRSAQFGKGWVLSDSKAVGSWKLFLKEGSPDPERCVFFIMKIDAWKLVLFLYATHFTQWFTTHVFKGIHARDSRNRTLLRTLFFRLRFIMKWQQSGSFRDFFIFFFLVPRNTPNSDNGKPESYKVTVRYPCKGKYQQLEKTGNGFQNSTCYRTSHRLYIFLFSISYYTYPIVISYEWHLCQKYYSTGYKCSK